MHSRDLLQKAGEINSEWKADGLSTPTRLRDTEDFFGFRIGDIDKLTRFWVKLEMSEAWALDSGR